jgi:hypothetical protein
MIMLLMLAIIGAASLMTSNTEMEISGNEQYYTASFYLADAGAERALSTLQSNYNWRTGFYAESLGIGSYDVNVYDSTTLAYLGDNIMVRSRGRVGESESTIEAVFAPRYRNRFNYAGFGGNTFDMNGGGMIDSYNSDSGSYASQAVNGPDDKGFMYANDNAQIGSNSLARLDGNAVVHGDVYVSPGGAFDIASNVSLYGDTLRNTTPITVDSIPASDLTNAEAANCASTDMTLTGSATYDPVTNTLNSPGASDTIIFNSGTYYFTAADIKGTVIVPPGENVTIYVDGIWDSGGGVLINEAGTATSFFIYTTGNEFVLAGGSHAVAAVYAPYALVKVTGGSDFYGSLMGNSFQNGGGTNLHFDEALLALTDQEVIAGYDIVGWLEL